MKPIFSLALLAFVWLDATSVLARGESSAQLSPPAGWAGKAAKLLLPGQNATLRTDTLTPEENKTVDEFLAGTLDPAERLSLDRARAGTLKPSQSPPEDLALDR